ncbi:hypothetical protein MKW98_031916 [Papaver atlanticum]|uniref:Beta-catenin-like protein 1 N-terminal domain-containing protein n=1 Tax=Papaver atlanticum TaxID=357466 RepID=A0AAD4SDU7_9MAGN|nr:hypothetical protein MKW98_031916 [Papaver atlanticum]
MPTPASDDCNPTPSLPRPSVTTKLSILSETLGIPIPLKPEKGVPTSSDQLQASFEEAFSAYIIEACKCGEARVCKPLRDCEARLIRIVLNFRISKIVNPDIYPDVVKLPANRFLAGFILSAFAKLTDPDILVRDQHEEATLFVESLDKFGALDYLFLLLVTLRSSTWDDLKMYAVGLLNTLLMLSVENRYQFGEEVVIVVVNALSSIQEEEVLHEVHLLQNLFSCLLFLLEGPANIESFAKAGGVQSMIGFIQEEDFGHCYGSAVVALDIAVKACQSASQKFVNEFVTDDSAFDSAFDTAFPPSMDMIPLSIMHEKEEIEEHQISLISSLIGDAGVFRINRMYSLVKVYPTWPIQVHYIYSIWSAICGIAKMEKDSLLKRFEEKFEENDFRRITWFMELYKRYSGKVEAMTNDFKGKQSVDVLLGHLWSSGNSTIQSRIESQLTQHNLEMKHVEDSLSAYRDNIGNAGESVESPKTAMEECIDSLEENPNQRMELDNQSWGTLMCGTLTLRNILAVFVETPTPLSGSMVSCVADSASAVTPSKLVSSSIVKKM